MNQSRLKPILICVAFLMVMALWRSVQRSMDESDRKNIPRYTGVIVRPMMLRQDSIDQLFSKVDGSHIFLTKYLKETLNDPDSYEHVTTEYKDLGKVLVVVTTYRAKNESGEKVLSSITVKSDLKGNIKVVTE